MELELTVMVIASTFGSDPGRGGGGGGRLPTLTTALLIWGSGEGYLDCPRVCVCG